MTYAFNGAGAFEKVNFHIPVFLYRAIDDYKSPNVDSLVKMSDVYILPDDIDSAAQFINVTMNRNRDEPTK